MAKPGAKPAKPSTRALPPTIFRLAVIVADITIGMTGLEAGRYMLPMRRKRILVVLGLLDEGAAGE